MILDVVERFKLLLIIGLIVLQSEAKDVAYGTVSSKLKRSNLCTK
jgi:hypothetical protein